MNRRDEHNAVPATITELRRLADEIATMGIHCGFGPDRNGVGGYLVVQVGTNTIHGVNIPAATALLDGVLIGAREAVRVMSLPQ
jgi:hypothetical protein